MNGGRVLLVRHTYGRRSWDLPGGAVRRGEAAERAASREMHEELGVRIERWRALGDVRADIDHRRDTMHCFHADLPSTELTLDRCELAEAQWFPERELPADLGPFVNEILALLTSD
jgi:8-oxo-dGTP pyrophosphatase MutT (NUDIX family)